MVKFIWLISILIQDFIKVILKLQGAALIEGSAQKREALILR